MVPMQFQEGLIMQTISIRSLAIVGAIFAGTAGIATAAQANISHADLMQVRALEPAAPQTFVRYNDLDLRSEAGQKALARRIDQASRAVCEPQERVDRLAIIACRKQATQRAYADLQSRGVLKL
jgi:UrcA family protein